MKAKKYYILKRIDGHGQTPLDFLEWIIRYVSGDKHNVLRKRLKLDTCKYSDYILIEKTCNPDSTETYSDLFPIDNEHQLLKKIGKRECYDYTGIAGVMIWINGKVMSWDAYKELKKVKPLAAVNV